MADTTLTLGNVTFQGFEIPEKIGFGGEQELSIKKLVGGARVIDAMGPDDADIDWSGRFQGGDAVGRALRIDEMRKGGQQQTVTVAGLSYAVVVRAFRYHVERLYQVIYEITLAVVQDNTLAPQASQATLDDLVGADLGDANRITPNLTSGQAITNSLSTLSGAITNVGSLQGATLTALAPVALAAANATSLVGRAIDAVDPAILTDTGYAAGVVDPVPSGGVNPTTIVANFQVQAAAIAEEEQLQELVALTSRIETNLEQATG